VRNLASVVKIGGTVRTNLDQSLRDSTSHKFGMSLPQRNELLIVINEEADRLNKLVGEAMKVTQSPGPVKLNLTSQAIEAIIDAARTDCRRLMGQRSLSVRLPAGLPPVRAD
jgi:K+-sensing histidine kinase KdpD